MAGIWRPGHSHDDFFKGGKVAETIVDAAEAPLYTKLAAHVA